MNTMNDQKRNNLAALASPYVPADARAKSLFREAMEEADAWHKANNPVYAALWTKNERPCIPVGLLKQINLKTPVKGHGAYLTSSGTGKSGAASVFYDTASMARIELAMGAIFLHNGLFSKEASHFLLLSPDPAEGNHAGYATAFQKFTDCAPVKEMVFCVDREGRFLPDLAWDTLARWANSARPIYLFGLTVFFEQLYLEAKSPLTFSGPVRGLTGGGWKGLAKKLERHELGAGLQELLRAPLTDIRDLYGMTEHPLHYVSCPLGRFHIPLFSRFSILNSKGTEASSGETGVIRLQNPFFASLPVHDLLTEDSGSFRTDCPCGNPLPNLCYHGRLTRPDSTCAQKAAGG